MKRIFLLKSFMAKIALVLVIIMLFQFTVPKPVGAASLGGTLLNPIVNLVVYLADGVIQILQSALTTIEQSFSYIDITEQKTAFWVKAVMVIGGLLITAAAIILIVAFPFTAPAIITLVKIAVAGVLVADAGMFMAIYPQVLDKFLGVVFGKSFVYSNIYITPETILKNQIQLFNVNFFDNTPTVFNEDNTAELVTSLRGMVSQVYVTVRDIASLAMLIIIIITAIRLLLALTPKEKSRYKESMVHCVVGIVIIWGLHFGMSLMVRGAEMITYSIGFSSQVVTDLSENPTADELNEYLAAHPDEYNNAIQGSMLEIESEELYKAVDKANDDSSNPDPVYEGIILAGDKKTVQVKMSNFTEQARYMLQKIYTLDEDNNTIETWEHIGWAFVYIMLVILTVSFVILYAKRTLYMIALTIFAPIVGVMYPLNRVNGSRSHTLSLWFKEYMANLVIQPFHLFLYTILIGSVMSFAIANPVYVIVAIMGITFIEGLLKDLLGIQDTRIGGLAKAVQDTTRAIKTTEKATTSIARSVARTATRGINAAAGTAVGIAAMASANRNNSSAEDPNVNQQPRVQNNPSAQNPQLAGQNGANALPGDNRNALGIESGDTRQDIIDTKFVEDDDSNVTTMPRREPIRIGMNDEEVANPDALVAGGNGIDIGLPLQDNDVASEFLDPSTLNMVDDLNGSGFNVIEGSRDNDNGYDDFVLSDGERSIYRNDDGTYHMDIDDGTNYQDPMAMAVGGSFIANTIVGDDYNNGLVDVSSSDSDIFTENVLGGVSGDSSLSGGSGSISYTDSSGSQSIPDGNTVRTTSNNTSSIKDDFTVWTNPNTPEPSSSERPDLRVVDSGTENIDTSSTTTRTVETNTSSNTRTNSNTNINMNTNTPEGSSTGTQNIPRMNPEDVEVLPPENNVVFDTGNGGTRGNGASNRNSGTSGNNTQSRTNGNSGTTGNGTSSRTNGNSGTVGNGNPSGTNGNSTPSGTNGNVGTAGNGTPSGNARNVDSNEGNSRGEAVLNAFGKGLGAVTGVTKKTASVTGTLVDGVIDTALNAVAGNASGATGSAIGSVTKAVTGMEITGSGSDSSSSPEVVKKRVGRPSQNVQYIVKETGMSLEEARAIEEQCKKHRINDDRNMAYIGEVYKKVSNADKKEIFKLSSFLYEMKRNGKTKQEARDGLDKHANVSPTTKDLLMKMYDKLHS